MRPRRRTRLATLAVLALLAIAGWAMADDAGPASAPVPVPVPVPDLGLDAGEIDAGTIIDAGAIDALPAPTIDARPAPVIDADASPVGDAGVAAGAAVKPPPPPKVHGPATGTTTPPTVAEPPPAPAKPKGNRAAVIIKLVLGLLAIFVVAYVGSHKKVVRAQERLGIGGVIAAGFPFVALGVIVRQPEIGILTPEVVDRMRPLLHFGLGWLGFIIGAQLDIRVLDRVPTGTAYLILVEAIGPFAITAAGCGAVMIAFGLSWKDPALWRDVIILGAAAAMTAPRKFRGFANRTWREGRSVDVLLGQLDELVGVIGLLFITSYFRDDTVTAWQIPSTAWVFVSLGLGVAIGMLIFAMVRVPQSNAEFLAVVVGAIAFAAGLAGFLHLSPIVICFLAGALVTNFPNEQRDSVFRILNHLERPVHLLFLIVAGAVWDVVDWRGWALVPLFVIGRMVGKYGGVLASKAAVGASMPASFADQRQIIAPMSGLSIALVVSVGSLYADRGLAWVITAVIGGSIVTELLVQATSPEAGAVRAPIDELERSAPIDELDAGRAGGPTAKDEP